MLLKTISELKSYVAVNTKGILPSFELELREVEESQIAPILGPPLLAWLQAQYDTPGFDAAGPGLAAQLLRAVQAPLARLAVVTAIVAHQAQLDETGVHIATTEQSKTAFQWQVDLRQDQEERRGYKGLDALVQWLEDHHDESAELRAWAASRVGQRHRRELFTSTADFHEYENICESRQVFLALAQQRRKLETLELGRVLSDGFLEELREQVRTRTLTSENESLLRSYIYPALASLTIGFAPSELGLRLKGEGIDLTIARIDNSNSKEADASLDVLLQKKVNASLLDAARFMRRLTDHLDFAASATRYATYFGSSAYTAPDQTARVVNTMDSKIFKLC